MTSWFQVILIDLALFDRIRIGLCGFDNPMRDQKTDELKRHIGQVSQSLELKRGHVHTFVYSLAYSTHFT